MQWLFPMAERSGVNLSAPIADREVVAAFHGDPLLRDHLRAAFQRMLAFYGLAYEEGRVVKSAHWERRKGNRFVHDTHNNLRITRILKSLRLLGLPAEAEAFHAALEQLAAGEPDCGIGPKTRRYWQDAVA